MKLLKLILVVCLTLPVQAQFADVPDGHYAESSVLRLTQLGIINGFPDGSFGGDQDVTRYQLTLMLSRMWDAWSTEQLDDIWSELVGQMAAIDRIEVEQQLLLERLEDLAVDDLPAELAGVEIRLQDLEREIEAGIRDDERITLLELGVGAAKDEIAGILDSSEEARIAYERYLEEAADIEAQLNSVAEQVSSISTNQGSFLSGDALAQSEDKIQELSEQVAVLSEALGEPAETRRYVTGNLSVRAGVEGNEMAADLGINLRSPDFGVAGLVSTQGVNLNLAGQVGSGFGVSALYDSEKGALVGLGVLPSSALEATLLVGRTNELSVGASLNHFGNQAGAAIPNLDITVNGVYGTETGEFSVSGLANYVYQSNRLRISPSLGYRFQQGEFAHQLIGAGLDVSYLFGDTLLNIGGGYSFVPGEVAYPNAQLALSFNSGAFVQAYLTGGDNELATPFAQEIPDGVLRVGVGVGIVLDVEDLW